LKKKEEQEEELQNEIRLEAVAMIALRLEQEFAQAEAVRYI
jgi:hypothetical protein